MADASSERIDPFWNSALRRSDRKDCPLVTAGAGEDNYVYHWLSVWSLGEVPEGTTSLGQCGNFELVSEDRGFNGS